MPSANVHTNLNLSTCSDQDLDKIEEEGGFCGDTDQLRTSCTISKTESLLEITQECEATTPTSLEIISPSKINFFGDEISQPLNMSHRESTEVLKAH